MRIPRHLLLLLPLATAFTPPSAFNNSSTLGTFDLLSRSSSSDLTCPSSNSTPCSASLPADFCCPSTSTCLVLAGNTTALCCPNADCPRLSTIPCDVSTQDVARNPTADIMTTALDEDLPVCGDACCPFGYSCARCGVDGEEVDCCLKDEDQDVKPGEKRTTTSTRMSTSTTKTSITATSTPPTTTSDTAAGQPTPTDPTTPGPQDNNNNDNDNNGDERRRNQGLSLALIIGVFGGSVGALALLGVLAFVYFRRHAGDEDSFAARVFRYFRPGGARTGAAGGEKGDNERGEKNGDEYDDDEENSAVAKARDDGVADEYLDNHDKNNNMTIAEPPTAVPMRPHSPNPYLHHHQQRRSPLPLPTTTSSTGAWGAGWAAGGPPDPRKYWPSSSSRQMIMPVPEVRVTSPPPSPSPLRMNPPDGGEEREEGEGEVGERMFVPYRKASLGGSLY